MPFTSGTVTTFDGATGFLQTMLAYLAGTKYTQALGTGDGSPKVFPFTLSNTPMAKGNVRLEFTVDSVDYQVYDDGTSWDHHDLVSSSAIDYGTGICTATIDADNTTSVDATYCVGQNSGEEGRDWLVLLDQTTRDSSGSEAFPGDDPKEVILRNSGVSYGENIYIGFREFQYVAETLYGINFNCMFTYDDGGEWNFNKSASGKNTYDGTRENYTSHPKIALNDTSQAYWIHATKNKISGCVRPTAGVYDTFYLGHGKRFASPSSYQNPLIAVGSSYANGNFSDTSVVHKFIVDAYRAAGSSSVFAVDPGNNYKFMNNLYVLPMNEYQSTGTIALNTNSKYEYLPVYVYDNLLSDLLMELEGVYACPGQGLTPESDLTDGGRTFIVFQDAHRTTYDSYMALEEEA